MIENPSLSDFPVRPQKGLGESLDGWCWRIYASNGHAVPQEVRSSLRETKVALQVSPSILLSDLIGADLLRNIRAKEAEALERWDAQCSVHWHAWSKAIRICPLCIRVTGYHYLLWQLPLVIACPVHGCKLSERCLSCDQSFSWTKLSFGWRCICGARLGEMPTASAPLWQVRLARMLAKAKDCQVPDVVRTFSDAPCFEAPQYRIRDLYGMLWWCLKLRRAMAESGRLYNLAEAWPVVKRRGARMEPKAWEVDAIHEYASTWSKKGRSMFNWYLRSKAASHTHIKVSGFSRPMPVVLIGPENWTCFQRLVAFVQELKDSANPLAALICHALENAIREFSAGIPGIPMVFFHPRLSLARRQELIKALAHWWVSFAREVPAIASADQLRYEHEVSEPSDIWRGYHQSAGVPLLNIFFSAAQLRLPPEALGILLRRWHLPAELREPKRILRDVGGYVGNMFEEELNFVYALLDVSIHRLPTAGNAAGCDG